MVNKYWLIDYTHNEFFPNKDLDLLIITQISSYKTVSVNILSSTFSRNICVCTILHGNLKKKNCLYKTNKLIFNVFSISK